MKVGDTVQLKQPQLRVGLPNGLYAEFPEALWELTEERNDTNEEI